MAFGSERKLETLMSSGWSRLAQSVFATFTIAIFLWYSHRWMRTVTIPYIVTVNFALMGWAWFVFDLHKFPLDSRWFNTASFERDGKLYHLVGIHWFRRIQKILRWNKFLGAPAIRLDANSLSEMERGTRFGEATHWVCLAVLLPITACSALQHGSELILWLFSALLLHIYPIMLQRCNRPRFRKLLQRMRSGGREKKYFS